MQGSAVQFRMIVADLEARHPELKGKRAADVPPLGDWRRDYRRRFYRWADAHFALAVFNLILALTPSFELWPVSTFGAAVAVATMIFMERRARAMTRQLHRPAIEQVARDLVGWTD